jgi:BirA family biotin operon repressor/biotin-[acetyl-CoA-carboxylase] ligase
LALAGGLALRHAIAKHLATERPKARVAVKWPNDVWVDEKKIAGILCESQIQSGSPVAIAFGFGVNLMTEVFPDALSRTATSFARLGVSCAREELLLGALAELDARGAVLSQGGIRALSRELSDHDALLGQTVRVDGLEGTAVGMSERGELLLRQKTGQTARLTSGTVEVVREESYSGK